MVATFCLRLACGLIACLPFLPLQIVPPRFFRVHYLTALAFISIAPFFLASEVCWGFWAAFGVSLTACFVGSIIWHLDEAPGGRWLNLFSPVALMSCLLLAHWSATEPSTRPWRVADDLASMALLGTATTAMLMGHSYLIAPSMSMSPLTRLLSALGVATLLRISLAGASLWLWTARPATGNLELELMLWLGVRWALGLIGPLILGWLAWETALIRSTQSATGILYVVTIVTFLGEVTSQLLWEKTGFAL